MSALLIGLALLGNVVPSQRAACNTFTDYVLEAVPGRPLSEGRLVQVDAFKTACRASTVTSKRRGLTR